MEPSRIGRLMQILTTLQAGESYTISDLSKMFGTSRRTIFRQLKELQAIGVPCYYDAETGGYTIQPVFFLPPMNLNLAEALSLLLLARKAHSRMRLPFKRAALLAAFKLENNLPTKVRQYCNAALGNISVRAHPQVRIDSVDRIFAQLLTAILRKRVVIIRYWLAREGKSILIDLSPYQLMHNDHTWYVLGRSSLGNRVRPFRLSRIKELKTSDKCFIDEKFDIKEYLGRCWSMIPGGRLYDVKLRFLPEVADDVAEVQWHGTQRVTFEDDGSVTVEFSVDGLDEIIWWILGYGDRVQVLAPRILREKIIQIADKIVRNNQQQEPVT